MDENANDHIEIRRETFSQIVERPLPPAKDVRTAFKSIQDWLRFLCANENRSEPVSEYKFEFFHPPYLLVCLVGYNHGMEQGVPATRIVFQPKEHMWFKLPKKIFKRLSKAEFIEKVH